MIRKKALVGKVIFGGILISVWLFGILDQNKAFSCNKTAGCVMDSLHEDYEMLHDGRMDKAMKDARDNVEAFRKLQAKRKASSSGK